MTMTTSDSYMGLDKVYSLLVDDTPLCMDVIHIVMDCCGGSCIVEARRKRVDLLHLISMSSYSPLRLASSALQICHQGASIPVDCLAKSDMMQSLTIAADPRPTTETISSSPRDFNVFQCTSMFADLCPVCFLSFACMHVAHHCTIP